VTDSEVEILAVRAGIDQVMRLRSGGTMVLPTLMLARFAVAVRAQALEDAARVCEQLYPPERGAIYNNCATHIAAAIRGMR